MLFWFLGIFFALLLIGIPVAFCLGVTMLILVVTQTSLSQIIVAQQLVIGADNFTLMAIPFFMLAAEFMSGGDITRRLVALVTALMGWIRGGLALVNIGASMLMAGLSGSSVADAAMMSSMLIPAMKEQGYDADFAAAVTATSSTVGIIIPPSIPMIVLGFVTQTSVVRLFFGGLIPGVLIGVSLLTVAYVISKIRSYPRAGGSSIREIMRTVLNSFWALLLPVFVLGGILFGVVTVTEASVVAAVYAFVVAKFIYRKLTWKAFYRSLVNASVVSATVLFIVTTAAGVAWLLTSARVPQILAMQLQALTSSPLVFLLLVNVFLLVVGAVMDLTPALLILGPILFPIAVQYGLNPIHFGVVMVTNLALGLVTPPVGSCLYLTVGFAGCSVTRIIRASLPFLIAQIVVLLLITYVPPLVTWLPGLL